MDIISLMKRHDLTLSGKPNTAPPPLNSRHPTLNKNDLPILKLFRKQPRMQLLFSTDDRMLMSKLQFHIH